MAAMASGSSDPREYITPDAFRVADHLIGVPLAKPWRRLAAILVDLLLVTILIQLLDAVAFLIAVAGAFIVFRVSRGREGSRNRRFYRHGLGCFGALLTFVVLLVAVGAIGELLDGEDTPRVTAGISGDSTQTFAMDGLSVTAGAAVMRDGMRLRNATRPGQRDTLADAIVDRLAAEGLTTIEMRDALADLARDDALLPPEAIVALEAAVETTAARQQNRPPRSMEEIRTADSTAAAQLAQMEEDSAAALLEAAAGDTVLAATRDSIRQLRTELAETRTELSEETARRAAIEERFEQGTFRWILSSISDELGLGLGWLGLYFVAFIVLGNGQTPGKRLFRIRVIRLDGRSIGWWPSLERFGGYYASVFTGLLGFAEMLWDRNRQAFQDKLAHTVVIQEAKSGARQAAIAHGARHAAITRASQPQDPAPDSPEQATKPHDQPPPDRAPDLPDPAAKPRDQPPPDHAADSPDPATEPGDPPPPGKHPPSAGDTSG